MADHDGRFHPVGPPQFGQRDHHRPQDGLHEVVGVEVAPGPQHVEEVPADVGPQRVGAFGHPRGEHGRGVEQFGGHPRPLRPLPGEDHDDPGRGPGRTLHEVRCGQPGGEGVEPAEELFALPQDDRPVLEGRPRGQQRVGDVSGLGPVGRLPQPGGLRTQRGGVWPDSA